MQPTQKPSVMLEIPHDIRARQEQLLRLHEEIARENKSRNDSDRR
ncbi:MAG: hypothetical protein WD069_18445 [Planctomycetales bacterium]